MADKAAILKQSQKFIAKGQINKAIELWEHFVQSNPDSNIYNTIGDLYLKINNKNNAITWYHKAAKFLREEGFSLKALAICKKVLNVDPSDPNALLSLGELNEEKGLVPDAIKFYLAAIDALSKRKQKDDILPIYTRILNLAPSNLPLRTKIAEYFVKEGFFDDASKELIYIARIYEEKGESGKAVQFFNKALEIFPQNKDAYLSMSKLYETVGKKDMAMSILKKALNSFPDDSELKIQVAKHLIENNNFDEATPILKDVADKEPENVNVKEQIGNIYLLKGNKEKAWEIYETIINDLLMLKQPEQLIKTLKEFSDVDPVEVGKRLGSLYKESGYNEEAFHEYLRVGNILKDSGMHEEALNVLNEAKQINPDNNELNELLVNLKGDINIDHDSIVTEKTTDEAITEADVFLRYGLTDEALKLLESLKAKEPDNIEVHKKLKTLYLETGDRELAITECLILSGLYDKEGNPEKKEQMLNEAFDIDPQDPRLLEKSATGSRAEESTLSPTGLDEATESSTSLAEEMAEADFYYRQGLTDEALKIYQKLQNEMPKNEEIKQRLQDILSGEKEEPVPAPDDDLTFEVGETIEDITADKTTELRGDITDEGIDELSIDATEPLSAEEIPVPTLENDVLEIFQEFKKGIESELDEEDSETHYNLGIAYKEMGLIDDAIKEFQTANRDPNKLIQASSMLGICYMEKGLYPLAIESFKKALPHISEQEESFWGTKYELAVAHEKNGSIREALELFIEIYSHDSKFRNVDEKINTLKARAPKEPGAVSPKKAKKDRISYI